MAYIVSCATINKLYIVREGGCNPGDFISTGVRWYRGGIQTFILNRPPEDQYLNHLLALLYIYLLLSP